MKKGNFVIKTTLAKITESQIGIIYPVATGINNQLFMEWLSKNPYQSFNVASTVIDDEDFWVVVFDNKHKGGRKNADAAKSLCSYINENQ